MRLLLTFILILFCSIYMHNLADATINGDYEQLDWIRNGQNGSGESLRLFKTYSTEYIQQLELNLRVETTNMWSIKVTTEIIAILTVICLSAFTIFTIVSKNRRKAFFHTSKNIGLTCMLFALFLIMLTYLIAYIFNTADLLSPEGKQQSFFISAVVYFTSPILLGISVYYNWKEMTVGIQTTKWRFYLSLFLLTLSLSAVIFIGIALLFTPDLSGNIS